MKEQEGAKIVAVLDPENGQTIADELGCEVERDLDTLYSRDDVDAGIVATPNYLHKEPVVKATEHGVNVFCEKPIALSYQDCDDMVRACQEHGVIFMAGHVMNFFHGVRHAKKLINDGVIGKYFIVIQHEMDGKNSSQLFRGKRLEKNQEVICTIIFMNWTVYSF